MMCIYYLDIFDATRNPDEFNILKHNLYDKYETVYNDLMDSQGGEIKVIYRVNILLPGDKKDHMVAFFSSQAPAYRFCIRHAKQREIGHIKVFTRVKDKKELLYEGAP